MLRLVTVLLVVATASCTVDTPSSVEGRPCPCPAQYQCIEGSCRSLANGPTCTALITPTDFRPTWSTPESIRWDWTPVGREADFSAYELVIGSTEQDVASVTGSAVVVDATVNPELGFYILPHEEGAFEVSFTITDGLEPFRPSDGNRYYAKLRTRDVAGCTHETSVAQAATKLAPVNSIPIFDDVLNYQLWEAPLVVEQGCGVDGSACLRCSAGSCLDQGVQWDNLRLVGSIDLTTVTDNALTSGQAYLELSIAVVSDVPVFYSEIELARGPSSNKTTWRVERLHIRAAPSVEYQTVQVPLNRMLQSGVGAALTTADLATPLDDFRLGALFVDATDVYVDDIGVRW